MSGVAAPADLACVRYFQSLNFTLCRQVPEFHEEGKLMGTNQRAVDVESSVAAGMLRPVEEKALTGENELILEPLLVALGNFIAGHHSDLQFDHRFRGIKLYFCSDF